MYGDGINCDAETIWALQLAGFEVLRMHVSDLLNQPEALSSIQLLVLPGGFSYGDEIASGKVLAIKLAEKLQESLYSFIDSGRLVLGICNGFQVLVQLGLLPLPGPSQPRLVSLMHNAQAKFLNKWVKLKISEIKNNRFFHGFTEIELPIRHGEGKIVLEPSRSESVEQQVKELAPLRYIDDVNGSFDKIAALTNPSGNVLGLMPHPEAFVRWTQNPSWTSNSKKGKQSSELPHGLAILSNAAASLN